jgi:putative membrane protein
MSVEPSEQGSEAQHEPPGAVHGYGQTPLLMLRATLGGSLMGLANLVPGISGGTMLLASGIYPFFMRAVAELSSLRFRRASMAILAVTVVSALTAILLFAGLVQAAVVEHRYLMYSLFIGLTLGGIPVVWGMARPVSPPVFVGAAAGFLAMAAIAYVQLVGADESAVREGFWLYLVAGVAGGSAMILPGISGGYILLVIGVYVPVLVAVDQVKVALRAGDLGAVFGEPMGVILPIGVGMILGIGVVSRLFEAALRKYEKLTMGVLLGFLGGSVLGLYPFQRGVRPLVGQLHRGQVLSEEDVLAMPAHKFPTELFAPSATDAVVAVGLVVFGFCITALVAKFGSAKQSGITAAEREGDPEVDHPA